MSRPFQSLMGVGDLRAVVEFAAVHGLVSIIDNTFASRIFARRTPASISRCTVAPNI